MDQASRNTEHKLRPNKCKAFPSTGIRFLRAWLLARTCLSKTAKGGAASFLVLERWAIPRLQALTILLHRSDTCGEKTVVLNLADSQQSEGQGRISEIKEPYEEGRAPEPIPERSTREPGNETGEEQSTRCLCCPDFVFNASVRERTQHSATVQLSLPTTAIWQLSGRLCSECSDPSFGWKFLRRGSAYERGHVEPARRHAVQDHAQRSVHASVHFRARQKWKL